MAEEVLGGVVAQQIGAEAGERGVVEGGVRVCGRVDECPGEGLEGESRREGEACVQSGEFG